jgi:hypothetical protein
MLLLHPRGHVGNFFTVRYMSTFGSGHKSIGFLSKNDVRQRYASAAPCQCNFA